MNRIRLFNMLIDKNKWAWSTCDSCNCNSICVCERRENGEERTNPLAVHVVSNQRCVNQRCVTEQGADTNRTETVHTKCCFLLYNNWERPEKFAIVIIKHKTDVQRDVSCFMNASHATQIPFSFT
jgi:hypothetical protein